MDATSNEPRDDAAPKDTSQDSARGRAIVEDSALADPKFAACLERLEGHWPKPKLKAPSHTFQRLGRFEIRRELGRGRFGVVFLAWDPQLQRQVALKVPQFDAAMDPDLRERFRGEALTAGQLQHSGIVSIYDVGQHAGVDYLAMAYVEGMTLAERLQASPLTPTEAVHLLRQLARAVHHAHEQGVIHRDLKPSNVLLDKAGEPHVTDFGLARRLSDSAMRATHTGQVLGTPAYMSPEQATGSNDIGPASDVYALGVILYETITGRPPFQAATFVEAVEFILKRDPLPPSKLNPKLPRELDAITFKCLEKRAAARYASAAELADDLQCYLEGKPIRARTLGPFQRTLRWARKNPSQALLLIATCVLIGLLLSMGVVYDRWQHADALAVEQRTSAETQRYFATVNRARNIISRRQPGWSQRAQQELQTAAALNLAVTDRSELRHLAADCLTNFDVQKEVTIATGMLVGRLAASPDGSLLAFGELKGNTNCRVVVYDAVKRTPLHTFTILNEGWKRALLGQAKWQDGVREFAFSNDNRYLAVGMRFGSIHCFDLSRPKELPRYLAVSKEREFDRIAFSSNGKSLFALTKEDGEFVSWPDWQQDAKYESPWPESQRSFAVAPFGNALFVIQHQRDGFRMFNQQLEQRTYFSPLANLPQAAEGKLTSDGTGQLLAGISNYGLMVYETSGGLFARRLQEDSAGTEGLAEELLFSRDGKLLIAFHSRGVVRFFDVARGRQVLRLDLPRHDFQDVALDPERRWLAVANDNQLEFWQLKQEAIRQTLNSPAEIIEDVRFSPTSEQLAAISTAGVRAAQHRTTLNLFDTHSGDLLARRSGGFDHMNWSVEYSQLDWSSNGQEILTSSMFGATIWRKTGDNQLDHAGFASLTGPAKPVQFAFTKPAKKGKQTAKVAKIPHPRDPARTILQVKPQGQAIQLQCRLEAPVKITNQLATLAISVKIDADHSFRAPLTIQSNQLSGPHQAPPWTWMDQEDGFRLWSFALPSTVTELKEFDLQVQSTPGVRSFEIERIDFVALGLPPDQKLASFATTQHIEHFSVAPSGERVWGCTAEEIHSWTWQSGNVASSWKNPNHQLTGAGNIRALQAGRKGTLVGTRDGRVHWLDPNRGVSLDSWKGAGAEVVTVALCEEADFALVGSENGVVRGLSLPSGKTLFDLEADDSAILALAATPDGQVLVTASADRTLKIWERDAGSNSSYELFCVLPETVSLTRTLRLSADGKYLAALGRTTETAVLWNLPRLRAELQRLGIE